MQSNSALIGKPQFVACLHQAEPTQIKDGSFLHHFFEYVAHLQIFFQLLSQLAERRIR